MDWNYFAMIWLAVLLPLVRGWTAVVTDAPRKSASSTPSPYIDILFCTIREQPWSCAREQSARILDIWDAELLTRWQKLKVEADIQLNATLEKRGYSASEIPTREKPSTILKKIEIGSNFMKEYLAESMDGFLGREKEYLKESSSQQVTADDDDDEEEEEDEPDDDNNLGNEGDENDDDEEEEEAESDDNDDDKDDDNDDDNDGDNEVDGAAENAETAQQFSPLSSNTDQSPSSNDNLANSSSGDEFIEIPDKQPEGQLKRPAFGGNKKKNKNKNRRRKKGQKGQPVTPATLVLVQQAPQPHEVHEHEAIQLHSGDLSSGGGGGGGHKLKQKRRKRKKHGQPGSVSTVVVEEAPSDHIGAQLLEELVGADLLPDVVGGKRKRKHKFPTKYGRSNGVTRTKKKKKRKALMKLILLGSFLKAKIELLLKILGAHLQIKFLAIALIGLLINVARFWIDVKRGGVPQKVVYVEHAHHQHHYEEHGDDWNEGGGGYWKRSLQTDHPSREESAEGGGGGGGGHTDSYQPQLQPHYDAQYLAYRNQWHQRQ